MERCRLEKIATYATIWSPFIITFCSVLFCSVRGGVKQGCESGPIYVSLPLRAVIYVKSKKDMHDHRRLRSGFHSALLCTAGCMSTSSAQ